MTMRAGLLLFALALAGVQTPGAPSNVRWLILSTCIGPQCTTPGSLLLSSTLNAISVRAQFAGDADGNNGASVTFRKHSGDTGDHDAYTPFMDRRAALDGVANPYANEARVSIVGLAEDTLYDVTVTWADPDGGSAQAVSGSVRTLSSVPVTGGSTITVTNSATLSAALAAVNPGQTIHLNAGTYSPFTITRSGNAGAWIAIEGEAGTQVSGVGTNQNIAVNADFVTVRGLTLPSSDFNGIVVSGSHHDIVIASNALQNVSARCSDGPSTSHYGDTGVLVGAGGSRVLVLNNAITSTSLAGCVQSVPYDGPGQGISFSSCDGCAFKGNTVTGAFRDGITSDSSYNATANMDVQGNTVTGYVDDGVEIKGDNVNVRMWGNTVISHQADSCIAGNTNTTYNRYGPVYIFRNTCYITGSLIAGGGFVFKIGPAAPMFVFHNASDTATASPRWSQFGASGGPFVFYNNASLSGGSISEHAPSDTRFDYNVGVANAGYYAYLWGETTTYDTFADFRAGTGQEAHGINGDPLFADALLHLRAVSLANNAGVVIPNFNSLDSAWPYLGSGPDSGAFEDR